LSSRGIVSVEGLKSNPMNFRGPEAPFIPDLSDIDFKNPYAETNFVRQLTTREIVVMRDVLGLKFEGCIKELGLPLYISEEYSLVKTRHTDVHPVNFLERYGIIATNYLRTDFASIFDDRILFICTWQRQKSVPGKIDKIAQIDFMFLSDYFSDKSQKEIYLNKKEVREMGGRGMVSNGIEFLLKVRKIVESINPACQIQLSIQDERRGRIYKRYLKDLGNVVFREST
jgi:hypothetical protein